MSRLLRREDGKRCCVGIYLKACGMSDSQLLDLTTADQLVGLLPVEAQWLQRNGVNLPLYQLNDSVSIIKASREAQIATEFAEHGVIVTFTD